MRCRDVKMTDRNTKKGWGSGNGLQAMELGNNKVGQNSKRRDKKRAGVDMGIMEQRD